MTPTTPDTPIRVAEWGHWGITFYTTIPGAYAPTSLDGFLPFPCGNAGPCDVAVRAAYSAHIAAWRADGTLPANVQHRS